MSEVVPTIRESVPPLASPLYQQAPEDLIDLAKQVQARMPHSHGYLPTKTVMRNVVVWLLGCQEKRAETLIDRMASRGLVQL